MAVAVPIDVQDVYREAIHGLPPWDGRAMVLHTEMRIDDVDVLTLAVGNLRDAEEEPNTRTRRTNSSLYVLSTGPFELNGSGAPTTILVGDSSSPAMV